MPSLHIEFTDATVPFMNAIYSICAMHVKKSKDYGSGENPYHNVEASEELGIPAWVGITLRMNDKEVRIKNFLQKGELANESVRDSIHDNAVYAILRLMEYDRIQGICKEHLWNPGDPVCTVCGWSEPVSPDKPVTIDDIKAVYNPPPPSLEAPIYWGHTFEGNVDKCSRCGMTGYEWEQRAKRKHFISCYSTNKLILDTSGMETFPEGHNFTRTDDTCNRCGLLWVAYARAHREGRIMRGIDCSPRMGEAHTPIRDNSIGDAPDE